jgi:hypothetical protein
MAKRPRPSWLPPKRRAGSSSKRLASVSHEALRRASPAENVKMGFTPKARRYVKANTRKITKATASVSARQAETKRVRKVYGMSSPEQATEMRRHGALSYSSQDQARRVEKAADRRLMKKARASVGDKLTAPRPGREARKFRLTNERLKNFERNRRRKLDGERLDDPDWFEMMDTANALKDHRVLQLRASPVVAGYGVGQ